MFAPLRLKGTPMSLPPGLRLHHVDEVSREDRQALIDALGAYNNAFLGDPAAASVGIFVRDQAGEMRAGLIGYTYAGWLFINLLWVHADLRRGGVGRGLMAEAERRGGELGCHSAYLDTFTFQAPEFYPKLGYREFGRIDYPPDHQRIFFQKQLSAE
jgi:GNAT superfamily N-acetyltransferase